jgi:hypothetical protein
VSRDDAEEALEALPPGLDDLKNRLVKTFPGSGEMLTRWTRARGRGRPTVPARSGGKHFVRCAASSNAMRMRPLVSYQGRVDKLYGIYAHSLTRAAVLRCAGMQRLMRPNEELLRHDDMTLRILFVTVMWAPEGQLFLFLCSAPCVKPISTTLGFILPSPNSHVRLALALRLGAANFWLVIVTCHSRPATSRFKRPLRVLADVQKRLLLEE